MSRFLPVLTLGGLTLLVAGCRPQASRPPVSPPSAPAVLRQPPPQPRPPGEPAQILNYNIDARIEPTNRHWLAATATLDWEVYETIGRVRLDLRPGLQVTRVTVNGAEVAKVERDRQGGMRFAFPMPAEPGQKLSMTLEYEGEVHGPKGGASGQRLWDDIGPKGAYVRFESGWYPRIEGDAATADITLRLPDGWAAIANGRRVSADNWTYHYRTDWPAAGFSFAAAEYDIISDQTGPVPVECLCFPRHGAAARKLIELCSRVLDVYGKLYGSYPFPSFAVAEIPSSYGGGHGDQGFIMLYEDAFAKPPDEEFVAHEIAHNWWGGLLACTESEFLIEGFANYSQALYREQTGGKAALQKAMREQAEAVLTASLGDTPVSCFKASSGPLLYEKGAWVLHMLRRLVGEDVWSGTVRSFVEANAGQLVTCKEFQQAFEEASKQDLDWFFRQWLYGTDIPWVRGTLTPLPGGKAKVTLTQHLVKGESPAGSADLRNVWETEPGNLRLLVDVAVQSDRGEVRETVEMRGPTAEVELDAPGAKDLVIDPDVWLLSHHRGLVGELDQDMQDLDRELQKELGDVGRDTPSDEEGPR